LHRARAKLRDLLVAMCLTCPEHGFLDCACDRARTLRLTSGGSAEGSPV
jgi:RNA polymerase sigma-70 factor (ECF subfamily)